MLNKGKDIVLSSGEKQRMRANLALFVEQHPIRDARSRQIPFPAPSKLSAFFADVFALKPLLSIQPMTVALLMALLIGGGTTFAAEGTLPGDTLYPVKVSFNEEVRSWIAVSHVAQADWDARRAERRLDEAEQLAAEGNLTSEARANIATHFASHAESFEREIKEIEATQNTRGSFEAHSDFEASLLAHERVLTDIAVGKEDSRAEVQPILTEVRTRLRMVSKARTDREAIISAEGNAALPTVSALSATMDTGAEADANAKVSLRTNTKNRAKMEDVAPMSAETKTETKKEANAEFKAAAEAKLKAAENKIVEVREYAEKIKASVSARGAAEAETKLQMADKVLVHGKTEMHAGDYGKAFVSFEEAIRVAKEAKLLIASESRIDLKITAPAFKAHDKVKSRTEGSVNTERRSHKENSTEPSSETSTESSAEIKSKKESERKNSSETSAEASVNVQSNKNAHSNVGGAMVGTSTDVEGNAKVNLGW